MTLIARENSCCSCQEPFWTLHGGTQLSLWGTMTVMAGLSPWGQGSCALPLPLETYQFPNQHQIFTA